MIRISALVTLAVFCVAAAEQPSPQESLRAIQGLLQAGQVNRAEELAGEMMRAHPHSYVAYEALGRVRDQQQRYADADAAYQRAMELAPTAASPRVSLGVSYARRGLTEPALQQFREALANAPDNLTALLNAGNLELQTARFVEAEEHYRHAREIAPSEPVARIGLATAVFGAAVVCSQQHKYAEAKTRYFEAIDLNPDDSRPYVRMGTDYLAQDKSNLALAWLYRAAKLDHGAPETLFLLGQALLKEEYFQSAHDYLSKYVQAKPDDPKGWLLLGDAYLNDERNEEALEAYQRALALVPQLATAHYLVGNAEYLLRRIPEARAELLATLRLDPEHPEAQLRMGEIEFRDNQDDSAGARFRALLEAHPADAEAAYDLAKVCMRHDQYPEARDLLMRAVAQSPDDVRFHYLLSQVFRRLHEDGQSSQEAATYARLKAEQDYQHRYIRHSHLYVE